MKPAILAAIAALTLVGCGGRGDVSGTVRFNGKPLSTGRITFVGPDQRDGVYSLILTDGSYKVTGCPAGPVKIAVQAVVPRSGPGQAAPKPGTVRRPGALKIPTRYADPSTSGLDYTVNRGEQQHDIDLKP
jgi:hypothetical protein